MPRLTILGAVFVLNYGAALAQSTEEYPVLVPLAPILAQAAQGGDVSLQGLAGLTARAQALKARAAALRAPVLSEAEKARLRAATAR